MPDPETWRWLIGGAAASIGGAFLMLWRISSKVGAVLEKLDGHSKALDDHAARILVVEAQGNRHSGQIEALQ